jgi:uncharacterized membrane protein YfcA
MLDLIAAGWCLVIGAFSGVLAALCGVGGGVIMVPAFTAFIRLDQKTAAATSLAAIVLTALVASIKNTGNGLVNWNVAIPTAIGAAVFAWFAADYLKVLSNEVLVRIFGTVIVVIGVKMLVMGK